MLKSKVATLLVIVSAMLSYARRMTCNSVCCSLAASFSVRWWKRFRKKPSPTGGGFRRW